VSASGVLRKYQVWGDGHGWDEYVITTMETAGQEFRSVSHATPLDLKSSRKRLDGSRGISVENVSDDCGTGAFTSRLYEDRRTNSACSRLDFVKCL